MPKKAEAKKASFVKMTKKPLVMKKKIASGGLTRKSPLSQTSKQQSSAARLSAQTTLTSIAKTYIAPYQEKRGEEYMNSGQRVHFRKLLNNWKDELMLDMASTVHHMQDEAANFPDPNDRATQEEEFSLELRTRDRELKLIKKIEEALYKVDNNEYGYCDSCGVEIGIRRLEARPTANLCIDCKTLDEIREKQLIG